MEPIPTVFISHKSTDAVWAEKLAIALRNRGVYAWLDKWDLPPGVPLTEAMEKGILASNIMIIILTPASVASIREGIGGITFELHIGEERRFNDKHFKIITIYREECDPPERLKNRLGKWLDFRDDSHFSNSVDELVKWIKGETLGPPVVRVDTEYLSSLFSKFNIWGNIEDVNKWVVDNALTIAGAQPEVVIQVVDKTYERYMRELGALSAVIHIAHTYQPGALSTYVFRAMEVVRKLKAGHEWGEGFGFVLAAINLLPKYVRKVALTDIFYNNIAYTKSRWLDPRDQSWYISKLTDDIAKHCLICGLPHQLSPHEILEQSLEVISWDVPLWELLVFFNRHQGTPEELCKIAWPIARSLKKEEHLSLKDEVRSDFGNAENKFYKENLHSADEDEDRRRLGLLLRIGEYLTYSKDASIASKGEKLRSQVLTNIEGQSDSLSKATEIIRHLSHRELREMFVALETFDEKVLRSLFSDAKVTKELRKLIDPFVYVYGPLAVYTFDEKYFGPPVLKGNFP